MDWFDSSAATSRSWSHLHAHGEPNDVAHHFGRAAAKTGSLSRPDADGFTDNAPTLARAEVWHPAGAETADSAPSCVPPRAVPSPSPRRRRIRAHHHVPGGPQGTASAFRADGTTVQAKQTNLQAGSMHKHHIRVGPYVNDLRRATSTRLKEACQQRGACTHQCRTVCLT